MRSACRKIASAEVTVSQGDIQDFIDAESTQAIANVWREAVDRGAVTHDGEVVLVTEIDWGDRCAKLRCVRGRYRHLIAAMRLQVPWCGLAVTGVVTERRSSEARILCGRRSHDVSSWPDAFELPPSGTIEVEDIREGRIDIERRFLAELQEETGILHSQVLRLQLLGVIESDGIFELVLGALIDSEESVDRTIEMTKSEYTDLRFLALSEAEALAQNERVVPTLPLIVTHLAPSWIASVQSNEAAR